MKDETTGCWTCRSNSGKQRISPGQTIYEGNYWFVEHAYPVKQKGWIVIVLKRHAEALHELTTEEFMELGSIQARITTLLHETLKSQKEYVSCYAEKEHFQHIHFHVFAKPRDLPKDLIGGGSFALINISNEEAVSPEEIKEFCSLLHEKWWATLTFDL
jgi:diadenosine tetraphosphate (Ap4A) HIT family hydrolase